MIKDKDKIKKLTIFNKKIEVIEVDNNEMNGIVKNQDDNMYFYGASIAFCRKIYLNTDKLLFKDDYLDTLYHEAYHMLKSVCQDNINSYMDLQDEETETRHHCNLKHHIADIYTQIYGR